MCFFSSPRNHLLNEKGIRGMLFVCRQLYGKRGFGIEDGCRDKMGIGRVQKRTVRVGGKRKAAVACFCHIYVSRLACKYMEMLHLKKAGLQFQFSSAYGKVSVDSLVSPTYKAMIFCNTMSTRAISL